MTLTALPSLDVEAGTITVEVPLRHLRRILGNAALFAANDPTLPVLNCVQLRLEGGELTAAATDRYTLGVDRLTLDPDLTDAGLDFEVLLDAKSLIAALRLLDKRFAGTAPLVVHLRNGSEATGVTLSDYKAKIHVPALGDGAQFPKWRSLFPEQPSAEPVLDDGKPIGFNPTYLARFAKVDADTGRRAVPMRWRFGPRANSPMVVELGDTFRGLIMQLRGGA